MQIESLKVFCDLSETESFTKAAQINQITQSAVSQQISSLERLFKSLLIERSKKKFRLTREGQVMGTPFYLAPETFDPARRREPGPRPRTHRRPASGTSRCPAAPDAGRCRR